jgi:hypothetical protein
MRSNRLKEFIYGLVIVGATGLTVPMPAFACGPTVEGMVLLAAIYLGLPVLILIAVIRAIIIFRRSRTRVEFNK